MIRYEKIHFKQPLPIQLQHLHFKKSQRKLDKHWHNSIEIILPLHGSLQIFDHGKTLQCRENQIYLINTKHVHQIYYVEDEDYFDGYCLHISMDYLKMILNNPDTLYFRQPEELPIIADALKKSFRTMVTYFDHMDEYSYLLIHKELLNLVYMMCYYLMTHIESKAVDKNDEKIAEIIHYMENHYHEDISMDDIAEQFHISSRYLTRLFHDKLGKTPKKYLMEYRLMQSIDMLLMSDYPIIDVALSNGFPNMNSYYREFNRHFEMTPNEYRNLFVQKM